MLEISIGAFIIGIVSGISPGPLTALAINETLVKGRKGGYIIAFIPILTDLPIILLSLYLINEISGSNLIIGAISFVGALFLVYLAYATFNTNELAPKSSIATSSWKKGIITNYLNPYPYIFWLSVGSPTVLLYGNSNIISVVFFIFSFYVGLVGSKLVIVELTYKSKSVLTVKVISIIRKILSAFLFLFAIKFFIEFYARILK